MFNEVVWMCKLSTPLDYPRRGESVNKLEILVSLPNVFYFKKFSLWEKFSISFFFLEFQRINHFPLFQKLTPFFNSMEQSLPLYSTVHQRHRNLPYTESENWSILLSWFACNLSQGMACVWALRGDGSCCTPPPVLLLLWCHELSHGLI